MSEIGLMCKRRGWMPDEGTGRGGAGFGELVVNFSLIDGGAAVGVLADEDDGALMMR